MTPWWHPDEFAKRRANLENRTKATAALRAFFAGHGFLEVETPALQVSPGLEPHLKAFRTELAEPFGAGARELWLHTSPEFAMKKLLVAGVERLFQLARCYRNEERSATHHPEFTMVEWYRAGAGYEALMDDCEGVIRACAGAVGVSELTWNGRASDPFAPFRRLSVAEAFADYAGIDLMAAGGDVAALAVEARRLGLTVAEEDGFDDVFFRIFLEFIEPELGIGVPCLLYDYPISMAALSRPKAEDPRLAERFELYVCGLELANAFGELTDAAEQRRRFAADMDLKERLYGERYPVDEDFLAALEQGMPDSAGIALGFDRLVMLLTGAARIDDVLWAPVAG